PRTRHCVLWLILTAREPRRLVFLSCVTSLVARVRNEGCSLDERADASLPRPGSFWASSSPVGTLNTGLIWQDPYSPEIQNTGLYLSFDHDPDRIQVRLRANCSITHFKNATTQKASNLRLR